MPNTAIIRSARTRIAMLDAVVSGYPSTTHKIELDKSDEPLEDGTQVSDHSVTLPETLKITGWVSDMSDDPRSAWETIRRINKDKTPLVITTEWGVYREMLLLRAEGAQAGRGGRLTLEFKEIIRIGNPQRSLPPGTTSGPAASRPGSTDRGRIALPPPEDEATEFVI